MRRAFRWMLVWHWNWLFAFNDLLTMSASSLLQIDIFELLLPRGCCPLLAVKDFLQLQLLCHFSALMSQG